MSYRSWLSLTGREIKVDTKDEEELVRKSAGETTFQVGNVSRDLCSGHRGCCEENGQAATGRRQGEELGRRSRCDSDAED